MKKLFLFSAFALSIIAAGAQTAATLSADSLIEKYLTVAGGADKWKKIDGLRQTGSIIVQGMTIPFTTITARPNLTYREGDFQGQKFIDAYDGTVAWNQNPFATGNKPVKKTEAETKEIAKQNFESDFIDYKTKGNTVELQGNEEIEGTKCYKMSLKRKEGDEKIYFFDTQSFLPIMVRSFATTGPMKGQAMETFLSDYKDEGGLMMPHSIEQKAKGQTMMTLQTEKVELNPTIDKVIFSFPK